MDNYPDEQLGELLYVVSTVPCLGARKNRF